MATRYTAAVCSVCTYVCHLSVRPPRLLQLIWFDMLFVPVRLPRVIVMRLSVHNSLDMGK